MRPMLIAGNWKMFTTATAAETLAWDIVRGLDPVNACEVAVCPPFPYLRVVGRVVASSKVALGAQNLYPEKEGAFTGEVSPTMLCDVGCKYVIVGHSERRHLMGESEALVRRKVEAAAAFGLQPILCVGETLQEREAGRTEEVLNQQATSALEGINEVVANRLVMAYEPVWAIGTGKVANPDQAQQAQQFLRTRLRDLLGEKRAQEVRILYGGSAKPENVEALLAQPDVDGALVGGASLEAPKFLAIIRLASDSRPLAPP